MTATKANLIKELEKRNVPCKVSESKYGISIECGWNYPDEITDKAFDAIEASGVDANVCAETTPSNNAIRIAGGPKNY